MNANEPVTLRLPDGTEREVRRSGGALRLIEESKSIDLSKGITDAVLLEILYYMMYDEEGDPPPVSLKKWMFGTTLDIDNAKRCADAFLRTFMNYDKKKAEEATQRGEKLIGEIIGSGITHLAPNASDSADESSGGDTLSTSSNALPSAGESAKTSQTTAPESSPQP